MIEKGEGQVTDRQACGKAAAAASGKWQVKWFSTLPIQGSAVNSPPAPSPYSLPRLLPLLLLCTSTSLFPLSLSSFLTPLATPLMHAFPLPFTTEEFMFYCSCCVPKMAAPNPLQATAVPPSLSLFTSLYSPPLFLLLSIACRLPPPNAFIGTVISALPDYASRRITRRLSAKSH